MDSPPSPPNRPDVPVAPPRIPQGDRDAKVEATFHSALALPPEERSRFLDLSCQEDAALHSEVRALLLTHEAAKGFMGDDPSLPPQVEYELARLKPEEAGEAIGPYKLREQIGEGGFGAVWVADQEKPVRRRVALKIIKLGMDTREVMARFEQERQALAMMDHPNIAKVLDAGATQFGRPFFVMELVRGLKITDYCDEQKLSTLERIELFIAVCQAVQHAHQKGIIHRDLKPSNILVTINDGNAVPKVIDFGVAKATQGRLTDQTVYTQFQQMIGTPLYMSPEQAELTSLDIDTRSDIYSLGVLLYELLTGHTPIEQDTLARLGLDEIRRIIREVDPPRPSLRMKTLDGAEMTTAAKRRNTEAAKLPGALRGDLDWIVMKCLEKDRKRRYDTANGLALDLQRHLKNEVVIARPPTTGYLLSKLIKRNKSPFIAGCTVVVALIVGFAVAVWQARRAEHEAHRSAAAFDKLRESAPAFAEQARGLAAKEQFDDAIAKLDYAIKLRPDVAEYLVAKADLLQCQFKLAEAAGFYREALRVKPGMARAEASGKLCDDLLAAPLSAEGRLSRESLAKLHLAIQAQQRPAAELIAVARLLGEEKTLLVDYWLARLKDLPVSAERPLKDRLTIGDDGRLALDLSDTKVIDLSPLAGAPLAVLNISGSRQKSALADLSPLRGLNLIELNISGTAVADLTPLREMRSLEKLEMSGTRVSDVAALGALRLKSLDCQGSPVNDLTPIRSMPLEEINLRATQVANLTPLIGMPIKSIDLSHAQVLNFSPLAQFPLEKCYLESCRITDLSVLRGRPLKELVLVQIETARNYAALAEIKSLELLVLSGAYRNLPAGEYEAIGALRSLPNLRQIGAGVFNAMESVAESKTNIRSDIRYAATGAAEIFWQEWDRDQAYLPALRRSGIRFNLHRHNDGLDHLVLYDQPLRDLSIFKGAPISMLTMWGCQFTDLTPLRELKLQYLQMQTDLVADVSPLRGMQIETLMLSGEKFSDLSPLVGLPLKSLYVHSCKNVTDVGALALIPTLRNVTVPPLARNIDDLRKLPLDRISFSQTSANADLTLPETSAAEFWKEYDANPWQARLRDSGLKITTLKKTDDGGWHLNLGYSELSDLSILQRAPINSLMIHGTRVADLAPLRGMPLKSLWLESTKVTDLSPLAGMALISFSAGRTQVTDISVLRNMPLSTLRLEDCHGLIDVSPLAGAKKLTTLTLPPNAKDFEFLRSFPDLRYVGFKITNQEIETTAAQFWEKYDEEKWLRTLRESGVAVKSAKRLPDGTWNLSLDQSQTSDLTILRSAPISILSLGRTGRPDLSGLRGMAIKKLWLTSTSVTDLSPLKGMPLDLLSLSSNESVTDLSVLRGMPLTELRLHLCSGITDLSPLADCKELKLLVLPPNAQNIEFLRAFPKLQRISYRDDPNNDYRPDKSVAEFWKEYDANKK